MTVSELIEKLRGCEGDALVVVAGYEGGYDVIDKIGRCKMVKQPAPSWYEGEYWRPDLPADEGKVVTAVYLGSERR